MAIKKAHETFIQSHIKNVRLRKSLPQILSTLKVIRSESGARIGTPTLPDGGIFFLRGGDRPRGVSVSGNWEIVF